MPPDTFVNPLTEPTDLENWTDWMSNNPGKSMLFGGMIFLVVFGNPTKTRFEPRANPFSSLLSFRRSRHSLLPKRYC